MTATTAKVYRTSLQAFVKKAFLVLEGKRLGNEAYLSSLVQVLERFLRGETKELLVNLPGDT